MTCFNVIVADPPWSFDDRLERMKAKTRRSAASQYRTLAVSDIAALDVKGISDPAGCVLALWVPSSLLVDGLTVMQAWGFKAKSTVVWIKARKGVRVDDACVLGRSLSFGMGRLFRQSHEVVLVGTSGKSVYPKLEDRSQRSVIFAPNTGHSRKPEALQDSLDVMFPGTPKCELFARRTRPGWSCVGDEIDGQDIRDAIQSLRAV